jgi:hypothetical protein
VTLTAPAPIGGLAVTLSSNNTDVATVPASVTVPAGQTSTTFMASTYPVPENTDVMISASAGFTQTATLTVQFAPTTYSYKGPPYTVCLGTYSVEGGQMYNPCKATYMVSGSVTLNAPLPAGAAGLYPAPPGSTSVDRQFVSSVTFTDGTVTLGGLGDIGEYTNFAGEPFQLGGPFYFSTDDNGNITLWNISMVSGTTSPSFDLIITECLTGAVGEDGTYIFQGWAVIDGGSTTFPTAFAPPCGTWTASPGAPQ